MTKEISKLSSIGDILSSVQLNIKAPKDLNNLFGKYKYRNAEGILAALKEELSKKDLYPFCSIKVQTTIETLGNRAFVKCLAILQCGKESDSAEGYAELEETKKGMDKAQITGAAMSYAKKYALGNLFAIDDSKDDPDAGLKVKGGADEHVNDWGESPEGKEWCIITFKSLKLEIEDCESIDCLKSFWKKNSVNIARLKKYAINQYEFLVESKEIIKVQLELNPPL